MSRSLTPLHRPTILHAGHPTLPHRQESLRRHLLRLLLPLRPLVNQLSTFLDSLEIYGQSLRNPLPGISRG